MTAIQPIRRVLTCMKASRSIDIEEFQQIRTDSNGCFRVEEIWI